MSVNCNKQAAHVALWQVADCGTKIAECSSVRKAIYSCAHEYQSSMSQSKQCTHFACRSQVDRHRHFWALGSLFRPGIVPLESDDIEIENSKEERPLDSACAPRYEWKPKNVKQAEFELVSTRPNGLVSALAHSLIAKSKTEKRNGKTEWTNARRGNKPEQQQQQQQSNIFSALALKRIRCVHCLCAP